MCMKRLLLYLIVVIHFVFVVGDVAAMFVLPFMTPWYVWIPLETWLVNTTLGKTLVCPVTEYENYLRRNLGMPEIRGFIKHYFVKPYIRCRKNFNNYVFGLRFGRL
jgi:hypothetical protein